MHTHTHTHQIKSPGEKRFLRSFPQINLLFLEEERRQIGSSLKRDARGEQRQLKKKRQEQISLDPLGKEQPNQPRTDPTRLLKSSFNSLVACSDVYLERQAESITCSQAKAKYSNRSSANTHKQCATQNNQADKENNKNKTLEFSYMAEKKCF